MQATKTTVTNPSAHKDRFVRSITRGKDEKYLNVSLPIFLTRGVLSNKDYLQVYKDENNRIIMERVDLT
jgi:hypothetical protein